MRIRGVWNSAFIAVGVLSGLGPLAARADTVVGSPYIGQRCSEPGSNCSDYSTNFTGSLTYWANDWNYIAVNVLRSAESDPRLLSSWVRVASKWQDGPGSFTFSNVALRQQASDGDSWRKGGIARIRVDVYSYELANWYTVPTMYKDYSGQLEYETKPYLFPGPTSSGYEKEQIIMLDDSETPADPLKHGGYLTYKAPSVVDLRIDTDQYYAAVGIGPSGDTSGALGGTISTGLDTLAKFQSRYFQGQIEGVAFYFNRGDLGVGREMHCTHRADTQESACYVKNYSTAPAPAIEFGGSASMAFTNMNNQQSFATVAMVSRHQMPASGANKVFFVVYNKEGNLSNSAALDNHGVVQRGTERVNFNNHIPTNCLHCHGANTEYNATSKSVVGALFLPFDLDNFDYDPTVPSRSRAAQNTMFYMFNQGVKEVATNYGYPTGTTIRRQIDNWYPYGNSYFVQGQIPGWQTAEEKDSLMYAKVVRPYCRPCHMTFPANLPYTFDSVTKFNEVKGSAYSEVCKYLGMPHAQQVARQFWQSDARAHFLAFLGQAGDCRVKANEF